MKSWVCTICGHVHEGDEPPRFCPTCKANSTKYISSTA